MHPEVSATPHQDVIIFAGRTLELLTKGMFPAIYHRVDYPEDISSPRFDVKQTSTSEPDNTRSLQPLNPPSVRSDRYALVNEHPSL